MRKHTKDVFMRRRSRRAVGERGILMIKCSRGGINISMRRNSRGVLIKDAKYISLYISKV